MTTDQMLSAVAIIGIVWVVYTMSWGAGSRERNENDTSFGLFDDFFD